MSFLITCGKLKASLQPKTITMASSSSSSTPKPMPADDIFSDRVNKTFASPFLASLQPLTSPSPSLWSPAAAVQKKEWRRDTDTSTPCSSSFHGFFSHSRNHRQAQNDAVHLGIDDSDVRSTIGLDPTLDNEEEEDTFDKVAIGRENAGDLLYMADVVDHHDVDFRSEDDTLGVVRNGQRDPRPRANLRAAKIRLNEDDMQTSVQRDQPRPDQKTPPHADEKKSSTTGGDGHNLKSILKRKEHEITTRASKRVRFDPECLSASQTVGEVSGGIAPRGIALKIDNDRSREDENVSRVPDYVQNPSKYTRYSLDSVDEMSDKSNSGAFFDYLKMMKKAKNGVIVSEEIDALPVKLPKSVTFVPKKRSQTFVPEKTFASLFLEKFLGTPLLSDIKSEDDMLGMVRNRQRVPRANLRAAKIRLNEDDMETAVQRDQPRPDQKTPPHADEKKSSTAGGDGHNLKSILKRKEHEITTRASKRVWFDPECLSASQTVGEVSGGIAPRGIVLKIDNDRTREDENVSRVPDYVQNPSKYTRYSLGSVDEMSDKSNSGAFFDYLEIMKKAKNGVIVSDEINALPVKLPKSVTFVPKKKSDIADKSDDCHSKTPQDRQSDGKSFSIQPNLLGLAAEEHQETGVDDMDSDEPKGSVVTDVGTTFKKHGR